MAAQFLWNCWNRPCCLFILQINNLFTQKAICQYFASWPHFSAQTYSQTEKSNTKNKKFKIFILKFWLSNLRNILYNLDIRIVIYRISFPWIVKWKIVRLGPIKFIYFYDFVVLLFVKNLYVFLYDTQFSVWPRTHSNPADKH